MARNKRAGGRKSLRRYEWLNLVLLLFTVVALSLFATWVFQFYGREQEPVEEAAILSEAVIDSDLCMFTVGVTLTRTGHRYQNPAEIRNSDPLAEDLFGIPGVVTVSIDEKSIIVQKAPSARWDKIQPFARDVINNYLQEH